MQRQQHTVERERLIADAIGPLVHELRLVDVQNYIAFMTLELFANVADIVASAAERYFAPGFIQLGNGGSVEMDWNTAPIIVLDLVMRPAGAKVYFSARLGAETAEVRLDYLSFDSASNDATANTAFLRRAIEINSVSRLALLKSDETPASDASLDFY